MFSIQFLATVSDILWMNCIAGLHLGQYLPHVLIPHDYNWISDDKKPNYNGIKGQECVRCSRDFLRKVDDEIGYQIARQHYDKDGQKQQEKGDCGFPLVLLRAAVRN